jgi:hypothetical protein
VGCELLFLLSGLACAVEGSSLVREAKSKSDILIAGRVLCIHVDVSTSEGLIVGDKGLVARRPELAREVENCARLYWELFLSHRCEILLSVLKAISMDGVAYLETEKLKNENYVVYNVEHQYQERLNRSSLDL